MDPASATLAILPLVAGALKAYKLTRSGFKVFCHYSLEVERIRKLFGGQRDYFLNETELALRLVLKDNEMIQEMMKNTEHPEWSQCDLEKRLEEKLGRSYESFKDTMEEIREGIEMLREGLECFTPLQEEHEKVSNSEINFLFQSGSDTSQNELLRQKPLKEAVRRLRDKVKITFKKDAFEKRISTLERANNNLRRIREQVSELRASNRCAGGLKKACPAGGQTPDKCVEFAAIKRASKSLHEALSMTWSKSQTLRGSHLVRLFLNADSQKDVRMQVAILCKAIQIGQAAILVTGLMPLQVRSKNLDLIAWNDGTTNVLATEKSEASGVTTLDKTELRERPRIRFAIRSTLDDGDRIAAEPTEDATLSTSHQTRTNFRLSGHFCPEIGRQTSDNPSCNIETCFGHIDHPDSFGEGFRHWLYPNRYIAQICAEDAMPVEQVLGKPVHNRLTIVGQLRLALQLAAAVLKFGSTPWLRNLWTVRDVAFFQKGGSWDSSLETLHLSTELAYQKPVKSTLMDVEAPTPVSPIEGAQNKYGIRNVMMYSLGVALLAIGRWERVEAGDVEEVRRLASVPCYLGPIYSELVEQVLYCDFGQGKDLERPELQKAVYECVILELQGMIARFERRN